MSKIIALTGGGSAGHVTPNLALVPDLKKHGYEVHYIGTENGIEHSLVSNLPYHTIEAGKLRRYFSFQNLADILKIYKGYRQSLKILRQLKPALVFAKGGFVSVPVVWAAAKLNIPSVLHESDYTPGLANRLCMKKARKVCLSFDVSEQKSSKEILTGSPVRGELLAGERTKGLRFLNFDGEKPVLLIMGGSLGAKVINDAIDQCMETLLQIYDVIHLRGKGNLNPALNGLEHYRQYEYLQEELANVYAATDLALSRAGANAIFEFLALKLPSLLIPLPLSASRGDQILNANYFEKNNYAHVLPQENITPDTLLSELAVLYARRDDILASMHKSKELNGTQNVLNVIYESVE